MVPGVAGYIREQRLQDANANAQQIYRGITSWYLEKKATNTPVFTTGGTTAGAILSKCQHESTLRCKQDGKYEMYAQTASTTAGRWIDIDGNDVSSTMGSGNVEDMTAYFSGIKADRSGNHGKFYANINLDTGVVEYALWSGSDTVNDSLFGTYASGCRSRTLIQLDTMNKSNNVVVGAYPILSDLN